MIRSRQEPLIRRETNFNKCNECCYCLDERENMTQEPKENMDLESYQYAPDAIFVESLQRMNTISGTDDHKALSADKNENSNK